MIVIEDHRGATVAEFEGELVADVSTDDGERARWIVIELYHLDKGGWAIHRLSDSVLYHRADTTCRTPKQARPGQLAPASELDEGAEPCGSCRPAELRELRPDEEVRIEVPRHNVHYRDTEQQVVDNLVMDRRTGTPYWSQPVVELLVAAGRSYPQFLALIPQSEVRR